LRSWTAALIREASAQAAIPHFSETPVIAAVNSALARGMT